ncbi:unnamed protein product [Angiostrongylus costaricensis]|uniref:SET domain-containing protein n=1 Tax=Angiostrongylus costaricensis TaxID=334426 RepID=A0A158PJF0_ANGCS|nr:unnamed protein product [Angiostrongylus costaricensis]
MDPSYFEFSLCNVFLERLSDILEQMSVTLELSSDRRDALYRENYNASKPLPPESAESEDCPSKFFRMGCPSDDTTFSKYTNFYVEHKYGEHPVTRKKMIDKKKYLCSKFSLMEDGEWAFEWSIAKGHNLYGSERLQTLYIAWTIGKLLRKIPIDLMQRKWRDVLPSFKKELESPTTSWRKLRDLLLRLECGMRRTLFLPQWWNNLGHTRLTRTTVEDRERLMKEAQRRKKDEREAVDVFDEDIIVVKHTKLAHGISRELTRMRDEKYRLFGRGELGGWIWISRTLVRDIRFPSDGSGELLHSISIEEEEVKNRKSTHIETIVSRLKEWRLAQEIGCRHQKSDVCYSPSCRPGAVMSDTTAGYQPCYSQNCRRKKSNSDGMLNLSSSLDELETLSVDTSGVVKAYDQSRTTTPRTGVLGEDLPWPLPEVHRFVSRGSRRTSIFVIPQVTLRRLAKSGGRKAIYVPSFSSTAKGNLQYWNYPAPRPCFDLCWRWLTANCTSLQSVALQLRILWASVRWLDMKPEDDDPDRRFVLHFPDRDERRWISLHKEYGPPCIYERYRISIEVLPLDDDNNVEEEDDLSWTSNERDRRKSMRRRKTVQSSNVRRISHIKEEWVDGVDLKLYEIYDYWKAYNSRPVGGNKQLSQMQRTHSARSATSSLPASGDESTSSAQNVLSSRDVVAAQGRLRYPSSRSSSASASVLHCAPIFTTERKRKPTYLQDCTIRNSSACQDYEYYGFDDDDVDDSETVNSTNSEGAELTGWEPRAAKRQRLVSRMDSNQTFRTVPPATRSLRDRSYQVDTVRGGGRETVPVGDGMEHVDLIEEGVVPLGAEETIVTTDCDNETSSRCLISTRQVFRNDSDVGGPPAVQSVTQVLPSTPRPGVVRSAAGVPRPSAVSVPSRAGKLLMVRRSDGTTQFLRQIRHSDEPLPSPQVTMMRARAPQTVRTIRGARPAQIAGENRAQSTPARVIIPTRTETRPMRTGFSQPVDPFMKRMAVEKAVSGADVMSSGLNSHRVYYVKNVVTTPPSRVVLAPTSVDTNDHEEIFLDNDGYVIDGGEIEDLYFLVSEASNNKLQRVLQKERSFRQCEVESHYYKFFNRKAKRFLTRPYRFEFENNEEEERAIAEAIAREEELMRKEEAEKAYMANDHCQLFSAAGRPYDEEPDEYARVMPSQLGMGFYSVLEVMIELVCRWDKQFGWYKNLFSKPKGPNSDRRRVFTSQKEIEITEHIDRLRREINKRRTRMENEAEDLCGLPTPWRKSRMKSHPKGSRIVNTTDNRKPTKAKLPRPKAINPAEISLGGDAVVWTDNSEIATDMKVVM